MSTSTAQLAARRRSLSRRSFSFESLEARRLLAIDVRLEVLTPGISEGESAAIAMTIETDNSKTGHTVVIDWGNGDKPEELALKPGQLDLKYDHKYADNTPNGAPLGLHPITVTVFSEDGETAAASTAIGNPLVDRKGEDPAEGALFILPQPFQTFGALTHWQFFDNDVKGDDKFQVTPLLVQQVKDGLFVIRGVGATQTTDGSGVQTFDFKVQEGTDQIDDTNYYLAFRNGTPDEPRPGMIDFTEEGKQMTLFFADIKGAHADAELPLDAAKEMPWVFSIQGHVSSVLVHDVAPEATFDIRAFSVAEGGSSTLHVVTIDPAGDLDAYEYFWDLDGDGVFGETGKGAERGDEIGASPTYFAAGLDGNAASVLPLRVYIRDDDGLTGGTASIDIRIANVAPTLTAIGGPYSTTAGNPVVLFASATDPAGNLDSLTYEWDLDNDGVFGETGKGAEQGDEIGPSPIFAAASPGFFPIAVRAFDEDGGVSAAFFSSVNVIANAPTIAIGGPFSAAEGGTTTLFALASGGTGALSYLWDLDGDNIFGETGAAAGRGAENVASPTFSAAGLDGPSSFTVSVRAVDSTFQASATLSASVSITNAPPTVSTAASISVDEGGSIVISATGSDPAGNLDPLTFEWDLDGDGIFGETGAAAARGNEIGATTTYFPIGLDGTFAASRITISVRASDGDGGTSASASSNVVVLNVAPTVLLGGSFSVNQSGSTTLAATATDPGLAFDPITFDWDLDGDGIFGETGAGATRGNEVGANPTYLAGNTPGDFPIAVRASDDDGGTSLVVTGTIKVLATAPVAQIAPATVSEQGTTPLSASAAGFGGTFTFAWDLDGDGVYGETGAAALRGNETGATPTFSAAGLDGPGTFVVRAIATDILNQPSAPAEATIAITNVAPTVSIAGSPKTIPGFSTPWAFIAGDVSPTDQFGKFAFVVDWGDGEAETLSSTSNVLDAAHAYGKLGPFTITVTAIDEDGGQSAPASLVVDVVPTATIDGTLYVAGTDGSDRIVVLSGAQVRYNGKVITLPSYSGPLVIMGLGGADTITVTGGAMPVAIFGGAGNDYLAGGGAGDLLVGEGGNDRLLGGGGPDILIGGKGNDALSGGAGNDTGIGGTFQDVAVFALTYDALLAGVFGEALPLGDLDADGLPLEEVQGNDTINGDAGSDTLFGAAGNDRLSGGAGHDFLYGGDGSDKLEGGDGNDLLAGNDGSDSLKGGKGRDALFGGNGLDSLYGGTDDDLLIGDSYAGDTDTDLLELYALWTTSFDALSRRAALDALLADSLSDTGPDGLYGELGSDWFYLFLSDVAKDFKAAADVRIFV